MELLGRLPSGAASPPSGLLAQPEPRLPVAAAVVEDPLGDRPVVQQQVEVAEHLPDDEQRLLGHRARRPQVLGDPVSVRGALLEHGEDALAPPPVLGEAAAHEPAVIGDRVAVTGEQPPERHRRRPLEAGQVLDPRLGTRSGRARPTGTISAFDEMPASRWSPTKAVALRSSTSSASVVLWPGRARIRSSRPPAVITSPSDRTTSVSNGAGGVADVVPESFVGLDHRFRDPVMEHQLARERAIGRGALDVVRAVVGGAVERRHACARASHDRGGQAGVVEMVVSGDHELDVLDAQAFPPPARPRAR